MAELSRSQILKNPEVLGVGNTGAKIRLLDADENSHIDIKVPDTVGTAYTFTLPADAGTNNYYLKTDGEGITSWAAVSASAAAGGNDFELQYNLNGSLAGIAATTDGTNIYISSATELRFGDSDNSNYVGIAASTNVLGNRSYKLPDTIGSAGQALLIAPSPTPTGNSASLVWGTPTAGTTQNPGGDSDGSVQYNVGGTFTGETAFKYNQSTNTLSVDNITATSITSDNINLDGNAIISTNTNGNIDLDPNGTGTVRFLGNAPLRLMDSDNTNYVSLSSPSAVVSDYNLTFPPAIGANDEVLAFTSTGIGSFVSNQRTLNYIIDGGGSVITTGSKGFVVIDFDCFVTGWTILGDQIGSIVVDVRRDNYTGFTTTSPVSISGSEKPTLTSAVKNEDLSLTTWASSGIVTARDILEFNVESVTSIQRVTVALRLIPR